MLLITGPNMAGKSVVLRQTALMVLLAQVGSFVPAASARVGVVDALFTRVGASDNLAAGESTFLVEMNETANILNNATARSLILLDEVGRGTSTFDGLSLAWAIVEHLHETPAVAARTLFATHYHELDALSARLDRVKSFSVRVREHEGRVVFLRTLVPGGADHSYGIEVARMAGLPPEVVARAKEVLRHLEANDVAAEVGVAGRPARADRQPGGDGMPAYSAARGRRPPGPVRDARRAGGPGPHRDRGPGPARGAGARAHDAHRGADGARGPEAPGGGLAPRQAARTPAPAPATPTPRGVPRPGRGDPTWRAGHLATDQTPI